MVAVTVEDSKLGSPIAESEPLISTELPFGLQVTSLALTNFSAPPKATSLTGNDAFPHAVRPRAINATAPTAADR